MAIQTFTAAQVLTAAQMNALQANDYNQTVSAKVASYTLVAADKGTRITMSNASATTITVNTSLFTAGDSLRIQNIGAGACTITAGTATVTSAGPLALVQWAGGQLFFTSASAAVWFPDAVTPSASGLVYITGASFTSQTTVGMAAGVFTSTYKNYTVILDVTSGGSGDSEVTFRVNNAGSARTAANYYAARTRVNTSGTQTLTGYSATTSAGLIVGSGSSGDGVNIQIYDPTNASGYTTWAGFGGFQGSSNFGGQYFVQEANDGLTFIFAASSTGFYRVYGYSES
jgi:hypothetical protein